MYLTNENLFYIHSLEVPSNGAFMYMIMRARVCHSLPEKGKIEIHLEDFLVFLKEIK